MIKTPIRNGWLLALCGVLDATLAVMNVLMFTKGPGWIPDLPYMGAVAPGMLMCRLAVAAGVCTIAAGIWSLKEGRSWLLVLAGLALSAFGLLPILWRGPLGFRLFALLVVVMAMSIGALALATARTLRSHSADKWFLSLAGAVSIGFGLAFLALGLSWIRLESGTPWVGFLWMGSYFGFNAICLPGLALLGLHGPGFSQPGPWEALPPLGNPKHAHIKQAGRSTGARAAAYFSKSW